MVEIKFYTTDANNQPFIEWIDKLDSITKSIVMNRIARIRVNNFGNCKQLKGAEGIHELVIDYGPGYRLYYARINLSLILFFIGGEKKTQQRDILKAKKYWIAYQEK